MFFCRFFSGFVICVIFSCLFVFCKFYIGTISINSVVYIYIGSVRSESGGKFFCEIRLVIRVGFDGDFWSIKN